jgi:hypothetical protein
VTFCDVVQVILYFSCSRVLRPGAQVETIEQLCGACGALILLLKLYGMTLGFIAAGDQGASVTAAVYTGEGLVLDPGPTPREADRLEFVSSTATEVEAAATLLSLRRDRMHCTVV